MMNKFLALTFIFFATFLTFGQFVEQTGEDNPFDGINVGGNYNRFFG